MSIVKQLVLIALVFISSEVFSQSDFIFGQDLSYVNMMEDCGAEFREDGDIKDVYQIFADNGSNLIRVRLWHNPNWQESLSQPDGVKAQYSNFEDVKETIFRAKMAGMKVMLGFHFSDFWCDPGRQILPKAWESVSDNETALKDSIYNYVFQTLEQLNAEDLMPEYVKVGNENNSGIMTHKGMNSNFEGETLLSWDWARHGRLYNAAIKAVRDISEQSNIKPKIALHVADHNNATWFYNNIINNGVTDFDIMGFTYYYSYHEGSPSEVGSVIANLLTRHSAYEAMVVETGYLWDTQNIDGLGNIITKPSPDYLPVTPANQKKFMVDLSKAVMDAGGSGVIFWESAWVSTPCNTPWGQGSSQEHVAFFDHRNNLNYMKNGGGSWPYAENYTQEPNNPKITFKVDMKGVDVSQGVYVTGSFSGASDWSILAMENEGNNKYSYTVEMMPGDSGAFYFLNANNWDARETVPADCATWWDVDRGYSVAENDTTFAFKWGTCETFATSKKQIEKTKSGCFIYPNPSENGSFTIQLNESEKFKIDIFNTSGQIVKRINANELNTAYKVDGLEKGIYFISLRNEQNSFAQKLMVL
ncbi:MAG: glycosyl hydrolase 53 family protein [Prolixibacteraceae bacterium]|jgi:arabinogalactan endo-1,4-beta-galactosidase|nr:glycosyl hydrolase 53 family protein [Prolixibacteraceae bacterium]